MLNKFFFMHIQYCEYYPDYLKCKEWLEKHLPTEFEKVKLGKKNTNKYWFSAPLTQH